MALLNFEAWRELHNFANDVLHSPTTQQALLHQCHERQINNLSEASLTMLDACGSSKEVLLLVKEHIQEVRFSLRRAPNSELGNESLVADYYPRRKKLKKVTEKCLRSLRGMKDKDQDISPVHHALDIVPEVLREAKATVIAVVESLSSLLSVPWLDRRSGKGFKATKLMFSSGRNACKVRDVTALQPQGTEKRLEKVETAIDCLELELDCMFRRLIQTRVSLLNIPSSQECQSSQVVAKPGQTSRLSSCTMRPSQN